MITFLPVRLNSGGKLLKMPPPAFTTPDDRRPTLPVLSISKLKFKSEGADMKYIYPKKKQKIGTIEKKYLLLVQDGILRFTVDELDKMDKFRKLSNKILDEELGI